MLLISTLAAGELLKPLGLKEAVCDHNFLAYSWLRMLNVPLKINRSLVNCQRSIFLDVFKSYPGFSLKEEISSRRKSETNVSYPDYKRARKDDKTVRGCHSQGKATQ